MALIRINAAREPCAIGWSTRIAPLTEPNTQWPVHVSALAEAGIEPDIVCGCSIGALVGAAYVAGDAGAEGLRNPSPGGKLHACSMCGCPAED